MNNNPTDPDYYQLSPKELERMLKDFSWRIVGCLSNILWFAVIVLAAVLMILEFVIPLF